MMRRFASPKCKMLAEKLETPHEFYQARDMGFAYFQGYFFCRPELIAGREVPANQLHYVRLLEMVSRQEIDMRELEKMLKQEASICYRLLRYLNSPVFGFSLEIKSVRHALAVLGEREMRRWIRLVVAVGAADQKCSELVLMGLARARFSTMSRETAASRSYQFPSGGVQIASWTRGCPCGSVNRAATSSRCHSGVCGMRSPSELRAASPASCASS